MEANSPLVRENCWEWYTSVVRTRMHNDSRELLVFTRWHEEDLIGMLRQREPVVELRAWEDLARVSAIRGQLPILSARRTDIYEIRKK